MGMYFTIFAFVLLLVIIVCFLTKKDDYTAEKGAYGKLLAANFFGLVIEFIRVYITNSEVSALILAIVNKFYILYIMFFILMFSLYVFTICYKNQNNLKKKYFTFLKVFAYILFIVAAFAVALMPVFIRGAEFIGTCVNIMYIYSFLWMCIWIISMIKNINKVSVKKFIPIATMIVLMGVISFFQKEYVDFTIFAVVHTIVILFITFTLTSSKAALDVKEEKEVESLEHNDEMSKIVNTNGGLLSNASDFMIDALKSIVSTSDNLASRSNITDTMKLEINKISLQSQALLNVASGISDVSKMNMKNIEIIENKYSIKEVIKNIVMLSKAYIGSKQIEFKFSIDDDLPDYLYGDASKVEQVCLDLMTNAIKNTNEGHIELKIDTVSNENVCKLVIAVSDTGVGMTNEEIDTLFDKKEDYQNEDGLVLSVTKELVEKMNGKIIVESNYGIGSKFIVAIDQKVIE